jgi:hypothetical protein
MQATAASGGQFSIRQSGRMRFFLSLYFTAAVKPPALEDYPEGGKA